MREYTPGSGTSPPVTLHDRSMLLRRTTVRTIAHALMCGLSAFALAFSACDDDSGNKTDTVSPDTTVDTAPVDTAGDTAPADTTPADTTPADTAQDTTPADTTPPAGACTNAADLAVLSVETNDLAGKA